MRRYFSKNSLIWIASLVPPLFYGLMFLKGGINFFLRRVHDEDFQFFRYCKDLKKGGQFIDVGGNFGQSALSYSIIDRGRDIISFEPNRTLEPYLRYVRRLLGKRYRYYLVGIGEKEVNLKLYAPKLNNVVLTGEASFDPAEVESQMVRDRVGLRYSITSTECKITRFDDFVAEHNLVPHIIKIDVQGYELSALRGMSYAIGKFRPILMMEKNNDSQFKAIQDFLADFKYGTFFYDHIKNKLLLTDPHSSYGSNYFAFPQETVERDLQAFIQH